MRERKRKVVAPRKREREWSDLARKVVEKRERMDAPR